MNIFLEELNCELIYQKKILFFEHLFIDFFILF